MSMSDKLDALKKQRDAINARIQLVQNREQSKKRKDDTRRKILIGSFYLEQAVKNNSYSELISTMDTYLTRDSDRKLFELPAIKK
jgi:hypothetical protein